MESRQVTRARPRSAQPSDLASDLASGLASGLASDLAKRRATTAQAGAGPEAAGGASDRRWAKAMMPPWLLRSLRAPRGGRPTPLQDWCGRARCKRYVRPDVGVRSARGRPRTR